MPAAPLPSAAGPVSRPATTPPGDCLTGAWAYSGYSSQLDDLQLTLTGVQIELGPGYVAVSSLDGAATGTLGPDSPNATYAVALSGIGAMASLEDGTIRWYADAVTGGLTGTPGGGTQGAQALVPELPMTVSCDATTARLATAGGTAITLTRSNLVPQPPTLVAADPRPQSGARLPRGDLGARHDDRRTGDDVARVHGGVDDRLPRRGVDPAARLRRRRAVRGPGRDGAPGRSELRVLRHGR